MTSEEPKVRHIDPDKLKRKDSWMIRMMQNDVLRGRILVWATTKGNIVMMRQDKYEALCKASKKS